MRRSLLVLTAVGVFSTGVTASSGPSELGSATIPNASPAASATSDTDAQAALRSIATLAALQSISPSSLRELPGVQLRLWSSDWMSEGMGGTERSVGYLVSGTVEGTPVTGGVGYTVGGPLGAKVGQVELGLDVGSGKICVTPPATEQLLTGLGYDQRPIASSVSDKQDQDTDDGYDYSKKSFPNIRTSFDRKGGRICLAHLGLDHIEQDDAADAEGRSFSFVNDKMDLKQAMQVVHDRGYVCHKMQRKQAVEGEAFIKCTARPPYPAISGVGSRMVDMSVELQSGTIKFADMRDLPQ